MDAFKAPYTDKVREFHFYLINTSTLPEQSDRVEVQFVADTNIELKENIQLRIE